MIKLSESVNLALHAAGVLGASGPGRNATVRQLAAKLGASEDHLAKVLQRLARAGILTSRRGPRGGYALARPAAEIRLLDVYEAVEGPLQAPDCLLTNNLCQGQGCLLGSLLHDTHERFHEHLSATTLASLPWPHLVLDDHA